MEHLVIHHGEEAEQQVESDEVGEVEGEVPTVGKQDGEPCKEG